MAITHPAYASLGDPLFACGGKRVGKKKISLSSEAEERDGKRSHARVSRLVILHLHI